MKPNKLPLLPGLDGLRAFSVAAVLLYHAQASWLPGGFLGVEFFFVISGFLITAQLLIEYRQHGRIGLGHFWQRRARRLLPAVFVLLLVVIAGSLAFLPEEVTEVREAMLASLAYVTNWYLIFNHQSYFESLGRPPLLQHLWSLAVEEQFYVVWPILLSVALKWMRPAFVLPCVIVLAVWSSLLMIGLNERGVDTDRLYYGTDTRAAGLLIGAALAFFWTPWQGAFHSGLLSRLRIRGLDAIGLVAAAFLVLLSFKLTETHALLYSGGFTVTSLTSAVLIAVAVHPKTFVGRALGLAPLRWIGMRSYSLYLWHWPVFMLTRPHVDVPLDGVPLTVLQLGITLLLADVSYRFVETPMRNGLLGRIGKRLMQLPRRPVWQQGIAVSGMASMVAGVVALSATLVSARTPAPPEYLNLPQINGVITATATSEDGAPSVAGNISPPSGGQVTPTTPAQSGSASADQGPQPSVRAPVTADPPALGTPEAQMPDPANPNGSPFQSSVSSSSSSSSSSIPAPPPSSLPPAQGGIRATAVGDSVMLGAAYEMARVLGAVDVDAAVGRQMNVVLQILEYRKEQGLLTDIVIVQVGNNGPITKDQFDEMMSLLSDVKQVMVMNVRVPLPWEGPNNSIIADGVKRYPNATFLDWHGASDSHPELFWSDNVHLRPEGAAAYVGLIAANIR